MTAPHGDPEAQWPEQTVLRVHQSVMVDVPLVPAWGSRPWAAVVWPDERAVGGWGRAMMPPGRDGRGYVADRLTPGDVIEFGGDYSRQTGRRRVENVARRWYGVILATAPTHVVAFGPFAGPGPARAWAERALQAWQQSLLVHIPALTASAAPPALPAARAGRAVPVVEVHTAGPVTRVDDPDHGRVTVDAGLFSAAMGRDPDRLVDLLRGARARSGAPELRGREPKATLAALAARHAPDALTVDPEAGATAPPSSGPATGADAVYRGHPDGSVERVDRSGTRALRPAMRWTPDGFAWGYRGDRPTELADALLADSTGSSDVARRLAPRFGAEVIAALPPGQGWSLPVADVASWAATAAQHTPIVTASRGPGEPPQDLGLGL